MANDPKLNKPGHRIEFLYAFIAADADGDEGLPSMLVGDMMMPLIGTDVARLTDLHRMATFLSVQSGQRIELREYALVRVHGAVPLTELPLARTTDD